MNEVELLNWARGPALSIATFIMVVGIVIRIIEIFSLGRAEELAETRSDGVKEGFQMILKRSIPETRHWKHITASYLFHVGLVVVIFFFMPHILLFKDIFGFQWPSMPNFFVDAFTVLSIGSLLYVLVARITNPARRILSSLSDYFVWLVTFLPLLTGYMAFHRIGLDYTGMLALHIISVEALMIALPLTKLTHTITFAFARWFTGSTLGRRGVSQ